VISDQEQGRLKPMRTSTFVLAVVVVSFLLGCAGPPPLDPSRVPPTVPRVELARYQGTWYEIARLPLWFQRNCLRSRATYGLLGSGEVSVLNECDTEGDGKESIRGKARVVDEKTNARLEVRFDTWFSVFIPSHPEGNYWILYIDEDYGTVIVGTPDRKNLWIMARTLAIDEARFAKLVEIAHNLGFDTGRLIRRQ
jgi:apolipoprotein D and lipocalin family protein